MDPRNVLGVLPHVGVIIVLFFSLLFAIEWTVGPLPLAAELILVVVVSFGYPMILRYFGVAPRMWRDPGDRE